MSRRFLATIAPLWLCGCPDPSVYGTPRTLSPGDVDLTASLGGYGGIAGGTPGAAPNPPSAGLRAGATDRMDIGARLVGFTGLGADVKFNFLRGWFDMAVDPMVQAYVLRKGLGAWSDIGVVQMHLPLLLGFNLDPDTTLVLTPGFVATVATTNPVGVAYTTLQTAAASSGVGARLGFGVNFRTGDSFSWQPEVTAWHEFNQLDAWIAVAGIGINLGPQPDYSDLGGVRSQSSQ